MAKDRPGAVAHALRAVIWLSVAFFPRLMVANYPGSPQNGDVFTGTLQCPADPLVRGMSVTFTNWDTEALFVYYESSTCSGTKVMTVSVSGSSITLTPDTSVAGWTTWNCGTENEIALLAFQGTLNDKNMIFSGTTQGCTLSSTGQCSNNAGQCSTFSLTRQIGWQIRADTEFGSLRTCGDSTLNANSANLYQNSRVIFECAATPSSTEIIMPGDRELDLFQIPMGLENFSLSLVDSANFQPFHWQTLDLKLQVPDYEAQTVNLMETNSTLRFGDMEVTCTGDWRGVAFTSSINFNCYIPDAPVNVSVVNRGTGEVFIKVNFEYIVYDCTKLASTGCSELDNFEAQEAIYYWSRSLRAVAPTKADAQDLVLSYTSDPELAGIPKTSRAIPWYRWQAAWDKPLTKSWNGQWNDWSFAWAMAFRILDVNGDGYITFDEYDIGYAMQAPVCPAGEKRISPIILGCEARSNALAKFSMADPSSRTAVKIPAYTTDLNMTVQGAESSIDLQVFNSKSDLLAGSLIDAKIKAGAAACVEPPCSYENSLAGINPGPATYFDDGASTESFAYTGVLGNVNTPWIIQLTTNSHLSTGSYKYSHGDRSPQAATDCTGATPVSGCDVYDASLAQMAAQVWGSLDDGQIAQMSIDTAILIDGFLPWFNWFRYWSSVMSSVPLWAEKPEKSEHVFRYADEDNDGYISSTEFELLRKVKVRYCKVSANRYQSSLLLFGSSLSPNPWAADVGSGCGSFGSYIVDVMAPTIEKTTTPFSLGVLPAGLKDFEIAFSSSGQCVTNLKLLRDADSSEIMDTSTTAAASGQIFSAGGAQANFVEYENVTESERRNLVITGRITEALQLSLTNDCPGFSYKSVHLKYKYDGLDPCSNSTGDAHGCTELDYTIADKELSSWSTNIANVHTSVTPAWTEMEQYRTYGDKEAIPVSEFYPVWCERSVDNIPPCSSWLRGFYRMDENHDGLVSYIEFKNAYDLQGSSVMVNELLGANRLSPLQYESTEFPMAPMLELPHCHCSTKLGEGWNSNNKVCMKKSQTGCEECMKQRKCASIVTATGDGLRDFEGDCVYPGQTSMCLSSTDASLAFPGAIAIDDDDNIYVADHGNNRIRMVKTATNHILTIAGSGRLGFAGDGGPGIEASLRYPEGIVVNTQRGTANAGRAREVFFSDFFNQRIRKVTLTVVNGIDVWTIYTVLGTGERGENPDCDAGCDAAVAILNNPRALAFSRSQDLYIVDSGVRKIRKFTVYASTPTLSTFIGSGVELDKTFGVSMKVFEGMFLSGTWVENNTDLALESIFNIQIDMNNNLWFADGSNNRFFMAQLAEDTSIKADGWIGRYLHYWELHFSTGPLSQKFQEDIITKLARWLPLESPPPLETPMFKAGTVPKTYNRSNEKYNKTYWKFAKPLAGSFCQDIDLCPPEIVQFQSFSRILGHCADVGNMYVLDQAQSLIMEVAEDNSEAVSTSYGRDYRTDIAGNIVQYDTRNCPCMQRWIDWEALGLMEPPVSTQGFREVLGDLKVQEVCIERLNDAGMSTVLSSFIRKPCTSTSFCEDGTNKLDVPKCMVNTGATEAEGYCTDGGGSLGKRWGYCPVQGEKEVTFERLARSTSGAIILGHEMRKTVRCNFKEPANRLAALKSAIQWGDRQVKTSYTCDPGNLDTSQNTWAHQPPYNVLPWSQLLGFEEPDATDDGIAIVKYGAADWNTAKSGADIGTLQCGGLRVAQDETGRSYCAIDDEANFTVLMKYGNAMNTATNSPTYPGLNSWEKGLAESWFGIVLVWSSPRTEHDDPSGSCEERCRIDHQCKAYALNPVEVVPEVTDTSSSTTTAAPSSSAQDIATSPPYTCVLYSETWPYSVYIYNRTLASPTWTSTDKPIVPYSRLFNFDSTAADFQDISKAYINTHLPPSSTTIEGLVGGPFPDKSLLLAECKQACEANTNCHSIAFPGCYLFNSVVKWKMQSPNDNRRTEVYIKTRTSLKVHRTAGSPNVQAFSDNLNGVTLGVNPRFYARESLLNRPSSCAFNSKGEMYFSDTWNHRIRKISDMHVDCQYNMDLFEAADVVTYRNDINDVNKKCFTNDDAPFKNISFTMQTEVVKDRELRPFQDKYLCRFSSPHAALLPTQNLIVLCTVCKEMDNRAAIRGCPSLALCACREQIVKALSSAVYLNCPASSAYYEKWHRFLTAYVTCYFSEDIYDADYLEKDVEKSAVKTALKQTVV